MTSWPSVALDIDGLILQALNQSSPPTIRPAKRSLVRCTRRAVNIHSFLVTPLIELTATTTPSAQLTPCSSCELNT